MMVEQLHIMMLAKPFRRDLFSHLIVFCSIWKLGSNALYVQFLSENATTQKRTLKLHVGFLKTSFPIYVISH